MSYSYHYMALASRSASRASGSIDHLDKGISKMHTSTGGYYFDLLTGETFFRLVHSIDSPRHMSAIVRFCLKRIRVEGDSVSYKTVTLSG